jgi:hypothetical protein
MIEGEAVQRDVAGPLAHYPRRTHGFRRESRRKTNRDVYREVGIVTVSRGMSNERGTRRLPMGEAMQRRRFKARRAGSMPAPDAARGTQKRQIKEPRWGDAVKDFSGEAATARSRTRKRAERIRNESLSREAATAERFCCRRCAALAIDDSLICGLTPAATCCRGFAAGPEPPF